MSPVRWVVIGWQVCLCASLPAQEQGAFPGGGAELVSFFEDQPWLGVEAPPGEAERLDDLKPCLARHWLFERDFPCQAALPGPGSAAPHWHGPARTSPRRQAHAPVAARNLVVEVRPIELNDAFGSPRGTFR
jgi:hypothetical protein